jgi:hypothetical protein
MQILRTLIFFKKPNDMNTIFKLLILLLPVTLTQAGTPEKNSGFSSEKAMFKQAERYYVKKEFESAKPLYAQLISNHKDNYKLNYCYGICLLITDKDKPMAIKYLEEASKSPMVWDDVWYYLGRAYSLNNEYNKALSSYDQFLKMVSVKQAMRWEALHQMDMCKSAKSLIKKPDSLSVVDTKTVSMDQVYDNYTFSQDDRKLITIPEEFQTAKDRKSKICEMGYLSGDGSKLFFTSYGSEGGMTTDIYMVQKKKDGEWGKPECLGKNINTKYDEAYPTVSEDGYTLYFSSKGFNSMGGFDIFKSTYYPQTKQWSKPMNMGVPINSTDDDFYYVPSELDNAAYYSSKRGCNAGEASVCKVTNDKTGQAALVINGEVINEYAAPFREAKIRVVRQSDGMVIGEFVSDPVNGKYHFTLPESGNYRVSVRVEGFGPMAQTIAFSQKATGRVNQEIHVSKDSVGFDYLRITNVFEATGATAAYTKDNSAGPGDEMDGTYSGENNDGGSNGSKPKAGLPAFSKTSKDKLDKYFAEQHKYNTGDKNTVISGLVNLNVDKEDGTNYKVQIGTFMQQTIEQVYAKLVELGFDDLSVYTNKRGWHMFYTGKATDISSTLKLKDIAVSYGFNDAFITVFENGRPSKAARRR